MAEISRICHSRESGLSEVIGFVLIIGLLVVVASLYLTYGIPAQGRENEILHMNEVKDQFVSYKLSLDSLFNNNKVGTTVSNSFTLGTLGGFTQGTFSFIPVMSPVNSGGTFSINRRTVVPETLTISSRSLIFNGSVKSKDDLPALVNYTPNHVYVNISNIQPGDLTNSGIFGTNISSRSWYAIVNLTPHSLHYNETQSVTCPVGGGACTIQYIEGDRYTGTDITLSVAKGGILTMQNTVVYRNISPSVVYSIDLMDEAYGLPSSLRPLDTVNLVVSKPLGSVIGSGNITYDFSEMNPYTVSPIPLGSIEYQAHNNYWIPQNYYYQMGGVFLEQTDGNVTYKLPPEITLANDTTKNIITVNINALTISQDSNGIVGGNSPIQIKSTLTNITPMPYVEGTANTKWIRIGVNTSSNPSRQMWSNYLGYTAKVAGIPFTQGTDGTETYILINGPDTSNTFYDINVIASNATYATTVHGVGGIVQ